MTTVALFSTEELINIRQFFEGVDYEVSRLLSESPDTSEENLTYILGQLLDGNTTIHQKLLSYKLSDLNKDLYRSSHKHIDISFQTHEHKKHYEGKTSKADMGIILEIEDYEGNIIKKGILIQCKRLKHKKEFNLNSKYGLDQKVSVDTKKYDQFEYIRQKEKSENLKYYYLFYNPLLHSFSGFSQKGKSDKLKIINYESKYLTDENIRIRPGIKATNTYFIHKIRERLGEKKFSLKDAYEEDQIALDSFFVSFSVFIEYFLNCYIGLKDSENPKILDICSGKGENDTVKHTLHLKIGNDESLQCNVNND